MAGHSLIQNQQLQASHQILTWIERAKANTDELVDNLPVLFGIVDSSGKVRRGNYRFADLLEVDLENIIGLEMSKAFVFENWQIFSSQIKRIEQDEHAVVEFELDIAELRDGEPVTYSWSLRQFKGGNVSSNWITVFGRDVSKVKQNERRLSQLYSNIPLGIMQLDKNLNVMAPYSTYCEFLFGRGNLAGKSIFEVLFTPAWKGLTTYQRETLNSLQSVIGSEDFQFDVIRHSLPNRLVFPPKSVNNDSNEEKKLGIAIEAIVQDEIVRGFMLILDNRTEIEKKLSEEEKRRQAEEIMSRRFIEVRRIDEALARTTYGDLMVYMNNMQSQVKGSEPNPILRTLHAIKGTARIAGLSYLSDLAHRIEDEFIIDRESRKISERWREKLGSFHRLFEEWHELKIVFRAAMTNVVEDLEMGETQLSPEEKARRIATRMRSAVSKTATSCGKDVILEMDWRSIEVPDNLVSPLSECLLHILTNAVDHGIEVPVDRVKAGKTEHGTIAVDIKPSKDELSITIRDNGIGLDPEVLKKKAIEKGILDAEKANSFTRDQALNIVFMSGFSTAAAATQISGQGIGLDAVMARVKEMKGSIQVQSDAVGRGTTFILKIPLK